HFRPKICARNRTHRRQREGQAGNKTFYRSPQRQRRAQRGKPQSLRLKSLVYALVPATRRLRPTSALRRREWSAFNAFSSILSPSCKSIARLELPSRLELKRPEGSSTRRRAPDGILPLCDG